MSLQIYRIIYCLVAVAAADRVVPNLGILDETLQLQSRILGGNEAEPHEFPHMVTLDLEEKHFCGGGILNENWVITAAHCKWFTHGKSFRIKAGKYSLETVEDTEQVINVTKFITHEKYPGGIKVAEYDIALLKLEKALVFNEYVQPIALPEQGFEVTGEVVFSGWGTMENDQIPDKLRRANFNITDIDTCRWDDIIASGLPSAVTDTMLCAGSSPNGVFACNLDSGSPLIKQEEDKTYLAGIFSWLASPCGKKYAPSVFTKVSSYIDWIDDTIFNNQI